MTDIENLATPVVEAEGVELVDLTYQKQPNGWTLCFYLDKPNGITLDDCQAWSDKLGALIEGTGLINHAYNLEVASPGLDRALRKLKHFQQFIGERVHAKLFGPIDGQRNFHGVLISADEETIGLELEGGKKVVLPRTQLAKTRLEPKIEF